MNINDLNHHLTPDALSNINSQIIEVLKQPDDQSSGYADFFQLIVQRDELVQQLLADFDDSSAKAFAREELKANNKLKEEALLLLKSAKDAASHFIRSQAAIKKYK